MTLRAASTSVLFLLHPAESLHTLHSPYHVRDSGDHPLDQLDSFAVASDTSAIRLRTDQPAPAWGEDTAKNMIVRAIKKDDFEGGLVAASGASPDGGHASYGLGYKGLPAGNPARLPVMAGITGAAQLHKDAANNVNAEVVNAVPLPSGGTLWSRLQGSVKKGHLTPQELFGGKVKAKDAEAQAEATEEAPAPMRPPAPLVPKPVPAEPKIEAPVPAQPPAPPGPEPAPEEPKSQAPVPTQPPAPPVPEPAPAEPKSQVWDEVHIGPPKEKASGVIRIGPPKQKVKAPEPIMTPEKSLDEKANEIDEADALKDQQADQKMNDLDAADASKDQQADEQPEPSLVPAPEESKEEALKKLSDVFQDAAPQAPEAAEPQAPEAAEPQAPEAAAPEVSEAKPAQQAAEADAAKKAFGDWLREQAEKAKKVKQAQSQQDVPAAAVRPAQQAHPEADAARRAFGEWLRDQAEKAKAKKVQDDIARSAQQDIPVVQKADEVKPPQQAAQEKDAAKKAVEDWLKEQAEKAKKAAKQKQALDDFKKLGDRSFPQDVPAAPKEDEATPVRQAAQEGDAAAQAAGDWSSEQAEGAKKVETPMDQTMDEDEKDEKAEQLEKRKEEFKKFGDWMAQQGKSSAKTLKEKAAIMRAAAKEARDRFKQARKNILKEVETKRASN